MPNMSLKKNEMPSQKPDVRNKNFLEVALGYTEEQAIDEAQRCLHCKNKPCQTGCPVQIDIPEFIAEVAKGDFEAAYNIISKSSSLPAVCGRVCPQESQCEGKCVRGIKGEPVAIGRLENEVEWESVDDKPVKLIVLLAVNEEDKTGVHVKLLSGMARKLAAEQTCKRLLDAKDADEIINIFSE